MTTVRLGLLFLRGAGRRGLSRILLMTFGTAIGVWCLLAALMFPDILRARQERAEARFPVSALNSHKAKGWYHSVEYRIGTTPVPIVFVAAESTTPVAPGVAQMPDPGEAVFSPALIEEIETRPQLKALFPYRLVGEIGEGGITGPNEFYAYVGSDRDELPRKGRPLRSFGANIDPEVDVAASDLKLIQLSLLGLVGIPLAVYFAVCARLSAATRDRRLAALRLIGMSARQTQRINAFEAVAAALVGSLLGLAIYAATHALLARRGLAGIVWFQEDSTPTLMTVLICLLVVPFLAAFLSTNGSRQAIRHALVVRRQSSTRTPKVWRLVPLTTGLGILSALAVIGASESPGVGLGDMGALFLMIGVCLTGIGLAFGFSVVPIKLGQLLASRSKHPAVLLGARRLEFEPSSSSRVVAGLVVVIFGLGFASGIQRDARASSTPLSSSQLYTISGEEIGDAQPMMFSELPGVDAALVRAELSATRSSSPGETKEAELAWASCADLEGYLRKSLPDCEDGNRYRILPSNGKALKPLASPGTRLEFDLDRGSQPPTSTLNVTVPSKVLRLSNSDIFELGLSQILLPPGSLPHDGIPLGGTIVLASRPGTEAAEEVMLGIASVAPKALVEFTNFNLDAALRAQVVQRLLNIAVVLGVIVGLAAFIVASLDRLLERRSNLVALSMAGVPARTLKLAQAIQVSLPLAAGILLAVPAGKLAEQVTVALGGASQDWPWAGTLISLGVGIVATGLVAVITTLAVSGRIEVSLIRRD